MPPDGDVTSVILMRHGETVWNRERRVMGDSDVPLCAAGRRQSERAAAVLEHFEVGRVVSSPLVRAAESARIVCDRLGTGLEQDEDLAEVRFGSWQGMTYGEIRDEPYYRRFIEDPINTPTPGGETIVEVQARARSALAKAGPGERVLFVSHGDIIRTAICHFLAIPLEEFRRIRVDNCGLTAVALVGEHVEVKFINVLADPERCWDPVHWNKRT